VEKKLPEAIDHARQGFDRPAPLRLMFQDEARFGRLSPTRYGWCPKPVRPRTHAMVTQEYTYAYAAVSPADGVLDTLSLPSVKGACRQLFVDEIGTRHGEENVLMVVDGAGWHRRQEIRLPGNLRLLFLPPYAPELNPVEHRWDDLREKSFPNRVFDSIESLEVHLEQALADFETSLNRTRGITGWPWIMNALST
jgi:DDE superfamily endonuclease